MKQTLTFSLLLLSVGATAQPILTGPAIDPTPGDAFIHYNVGPTTKPSPGSAGAAVTWDFHTLAGTNSDTETVMISSGTPYAGLYPSANVASYSGYGYSYYDVSTSMLAAVGYASPADTQTITGLTVLEFPLSYGGTFNGTYSLTNILAGAGVYEYQTGTRTTTYDGYGTLITPVGTFDNVGRLNIISVVTDSTISSGVSTVITDTTYAYAWFMPGFHSPLLSVNILFHGGMSDTGASYATTLPTAVPQQAKTEPGLDVFPNPAGSITNIRFSAPADGVATVTINDILGRELTTVASGHFDAGTHSLLFNTATLAPGMYLVRVVGTNGVLQQRLVVR